MEINKTNNLLELFFVQYQKKNKESTFLQSLKEPQKKIFMGGCLFKYK